MSVWESFKLLLIARINKSKVEENCFIGKRSHIFSSQIGAHCKIEKRSKIKNSVLEEHILIGASSKLKDVTIGSFSYLSKNAHLTNLSIGRFCSIGPNIKNHLGNHPTKVFVSTHPSFYTPLSSVNSFVDIETFVSYGERVVIGNDVWIGEDVIIMDGVKIGNGAIVATRAVVTKDVAPYSIVGGLPAKHIRYRFNKETIDRLEKIKWWNKDLSWIKNNISEFQDINSFLKKHSSLQ